MIEAENSDGEQYGESRFLESVLANKEKNSNAILDGLFESIQTFVQQVPQEDDMTMIVLKRK